MSTRIEFLSSPWTSLAAIPLSLLSDRNFLALTELPEDLPAGNLPSISVIIPARDEARNLRRLLPQLKSMRYPGDVEIMVVNDHSRDSTGEVARQYSTRVIDLYAGLPPGWLGKPNACHQGVLASRGEWLLFTDADTSHSPDGIARAVQFAVDHSLDGLSLFLRQDCDHPFDRLVLATAFTGLFAGMHADNGMLNGQYILIRREAYFRSGGFSQVSDQALEDVALGVHLNKKGYRLPVLRSETAASVNMYSSREQMFAGMSRIGPGWLRHAGWGTLSSLALITALLSPLVVLSGVLTGKLRLRWLPPAWGASALALAPWSRRMGSPKLALLAPIGALMVVAASAWGLVSRLTRRGVLWKGRRV